MSGFRVRLLIIKGALICPVYPALSTVATTWSVFPAGVAFTRSSPSYVYLKSLYERPEIPAIVNPAIWVSLNATCLPV